MKRGRVLVGAFFILAACKATTPTDDSPSAARALRCVGRERRRRGDHRAPVSPLGPEAGDAGGTIVFEGKPAQLKKRKTATGRALGKLAAAPASAAE
jgi:hypothetical protein